MPAITLLFFFVHSWFMNPFVLGTRNKPLFVFWLWKAILHLKTRNPCRMGKGSAVPIRSVATDHDKRGVDVPYVMDINSCWVGGD